MEHKSWISYINNNKTQTFNNCPPIERKKILEKSLVLQATPQLCLLFDSPNLLKGLSSFFEDFGVWIKDSLDHSELPASCCFWRMSFFSRASVSATLRSKSLRTLKSWIFADFKLSWLIWLLNFCEQKLPSSNHSKISSKCHQWCQRPPNVKSPGSAAASLSSKCWAQNDCHLEQWECSVVKQKTHGMMQYFISVLSVISPHPALIMIWYLFHGTFQQTITHPTSTRPRWSNPTRSSGWCADSLV